LFGISFTELTLVAIVALIVVGPQKLPYMLGTLGKWIGKLRRMSTEVRRQTGIDDLLREEGLGGGLNELRGLMRGGGFPRHSPAAALTRRTVERVEMDPSREYPEEGPDAYGALPDDLADDDDDDDDDDQEDGKDGKDGDEETASAASSLTSEPAAPGATAVTPPRPTPPAAPPERRPPPPRKPLSVPRPSLANAPSQDGADRAHSSEARVSQHSDARADGSPDERDESNPDSTATEKGSSPGS